MERFLLNPDIALILPRRPFGVHPPMGFRKCPKYEQKDEAISAKPGYPDVIASFTLGIARWNLIQKKARWPWFLIHGLKFGNLQLILP
nr:hypothetical protein [uncultured Rhodoferax sp.]